MAEISYQIIQDHDLTIIKVQGSASIADLEQVYDEIGSRRLTTNSIWDVTHGSVGNLSGAEVRQIAGQLKRGAGMCPNGRTAIVAPRDLDYGIGRMFEVYADIERLTVKFVTFRSMVEAKVWLGVDTSLEFDEPAEKVTSIASGKTFRGLYTV